mgnify:CR=1 FL=1
MSPDLNRVTAIAAYDWPLKRLRQPPHLSGCYDLREDPWERTHLTDRPDLAETLGRLEQMIEEASTELESQLGANRRQLSEDEREALRSLGYLD